MQSTSVPATSRLRRAGAAFLLTAALAAQLLAARGNAAIAAEAAHPAPASARHVIVMVWDGLRPSSINPTDTPNLDRLRAEGVDFAANHSTFPTVTMINAASFATGAYPGTTGFYGNSIYLPDARGDDADGEPIPFERPVFVEDYGVLDAVDRRHEGRLFKVETLFEAAHRRHLVTATIGKSGPAYLQDHHRGGAILDENLVWPRALAERLRDAKQPLPLHTTLAYGQPPLVLEDDNGDPTGAGAVTRLKEDAASDPTDRAGSTNKDANRYMLRAYLDHVLPEQKPALSVIWFRDPDSTEHQYGPGSANYRDALRAQDARLGELRDRLRTLGLAASTDLIVVSDHGHSSVSGPLALFPPRAISGGAPGHIDREGGYSVSGEVRLADLIRRADIGLDAYDDKGCMLSPSLSGIRIDGTRVYPTQVDDSGLVCGKTGASYTTAVPPLKTSTTLTRNSVIVATNGGNELVYLPAHDQATLAKLVRFLQGRSEVGAIFVAQRYGDIAGTLPMSTVRIDSGDSRAPDLIFSYRYDADARIHGVAGIEYASMSSNRGSHGTLGPRDVHNTFIAAGPHFRRGFRDPLPSGNVDLAPTVAAILDIPLPQADGRPLLEALTIDGGVDAARYQVRDFRIDAKQRATGLIVCYPTDPDCHERDTARPTYAARVVGKDVQLGERHWRYYDAADAVRE
ncbi:alkaline phosphatase family protein [Dokdonella soli]|uniref:Alkaline phosphatase family protein n=1 Tax=Dokdonella soli TaxID=529810 RepID=A0ABN1IZU7_9GAMM